MATRTLLTTAEAAQRMGISIWTVSRRARAGKLPYVRKLPGIRGGYLFDPGALDRAAGRRPSLTPASAVGGG